MSDVVTDIHRARAAQQPEWADPSLAQRVRAILAGHPPLVRAPDVRLLKSLLARVAAGEVHVVQGGDCAEDPEGFNGIREAVEAGVPMVALPMLAETPANARRVVELGAGLSLAPEQLTVASLRSAVERVLGGPEPRARARWLQRQMLALPPLSQLVDDVQAVPDGSHARGR